MPQIIDLSPTPIIDPRIGPPTAPNVPVRPETTQRPAAENYQQPVRYGPKPSVLGGLARGGVLGALGAAFADKPQIHDLGSVGDQRLATDDYGRFYLNDQPFRGDPSELYEFVRFQQDQQANASEQDYLGKYRTGVLDNQGRDALRDKQIYGQSDALFPLRQQREQAGLFNTQNTIDTRNQRLAMTQEDRALKQRLDEETRTAGARLNRTALGAIGPQLGLSQDDADSFAAVADVVPPEQFNALLTQYRLSRSTGGTGGEVTEAANKAWSQAVEDRFATQSDEIASRIKEIDAALEPLRAEIDYAEGQHPTENRALRPGELIDGRKVQAPESLLRKSRELRTEKAGLIKKMSRLTNRSMYRWRSGYPRSLAEASPIIGEDIGVRIAQQVAQEVSDELGIPVEQMTPEQQAEVQARTEQALFEMGWKP